MSDEPYYAQSVAETHRPYVAAEDRYQRFEYRRVGDSGLLLPPLSLGLWYNFGDDKPFDTQREVLRHAFDSGITHFDLANNYGPPYGSAEENFGRMMRTDFAPYRDEMIISSKAGWDMWPGPYGNASSRKYLLSSLDASLKRLSLDHVDIFYSHRFDPDTPVSETIAALDTAVRQGKATYVGISSYSPERTAEAVGIANELGTPLVIHQPAYSMLNRWVERGLLTVLEEHGMGSIAFTVLAQGLLSDRYLGDEPTTTSEPADVRPEPRQRRQPRTAARAQRRGRGTWADPGPDGAVMGAASRGRHVRAHRRLVGQAARREPEGGRQHRLLRRRARRDRPAGR